MDGPTHCFHKWVASNLLAEEKKRLAEEIKEITLVWNISYHKRCLLHDKGIYTWQDPLLLNNILQLTY